MMKDEIVIAEALDGQIRIHAACTTALVEQARMHHHCMPTSIRQNINSDCYHGI